MTRVSIGRFLFLQTRRIIVSVVLRFFPSILLCTRTLVLCQLKPKRVTFLHYYILGEESSFDSLRTERNFLWFFFIKFWMGKRKRVNIMYYTIWPGILGVNYIKDCKDNFHSFRVIITSFHVEGRRLLFCKLSATKKEKGYCILRYALFHTLSFIFIDWLV